MESFLQWLSTSQPAAWVQALGTPIIGAAALYVAYQSARTARKKLKFDMFEKRVRVYEQVRDFFKLTDTGALSVDERQELAAAQAHAKFLFSDSRIDGYLTTLMEKSQRLSYAPPPPRPKALGNDFMQEYNGFQRDPVRHLRSAIMVRYRNSRAHSSAPPLVGERDKMWLDAAIWIHDNKSTWDDLTLSYLRLNH